MQKKSQPDTDAELEEKMNLHKNNVKQKRFKT